MSKLDKALAKLANAYEEAKQELVKSYVKDEVWFPRSGEYYIQPNLEVVRGTPYAGTRDVANEFQTREEAEEFAVMIRKLFLINEYSKQIAEFVDNPNDPVNRILYHANGEWHFSSYTNNDYLSPKMSEEVAKILTNKLNSGEIVI